MKKQNDWYMEAETLEEQEFEIDLLKAQIEYLESGSKSENNLKMIAELKIELAEAIEFYETTKQYLKNLKKSAA